MDGRTTTSDAVAQVNHGRIGSLVGARGQKLTTENLQYLETLRRQAYEWIDSIDDEIARIEIARVARLMAVQS
jgi:hypothetical protein